MTADKKGGAPARALPALRVSQQAQDLADELRSLAPQVPADQRATWLLHADRAEEAAAFLNSVTTEPTGSPSRAPWPLAQRKQFGALLRDKRNAAGYSRVQLARKAKLSDATIKFIETARHPPSRATLLRLVGVPELKLHWADVPGELTPPPESPDASAAPAPAPAHSARPLNCYLAPQEDTLARRADFVRLLGGVGGYADSSTAYLEPESAAAYLALTQRDLQIISRRAAMPLAKVAEKIRAQTAATRLHIVALGAGDAELEARLAAHLVADPPIALDLCLVDLSAPLLAAGYRHAAQMLAGRVGADVWAAHCDFHDLSRYPEVFGLPTKRPGCRVVCMLGGTFGSVAQERRFLQQSLLLAVPDDWLVLDVPLALGSPTDPAGLRRKDRLFADGPPPAMTQWLGGPIWRYCKGVTGVEFTIEPEPYSTMPGAYALSAVAHVSTAAPGSERRFSLYRFGRYDLAELSACLRGMGWDEAAAIPYAGDHALMLYRKT